MLPGRKGTMCIWLIWEFVESLLLRGSLFWQLSSPKVPVGSRFLPETAGMSWERVFLKLVVLAAVVCPVPRAAWKSGALAVLCL